MRSRMPRKNLDLELQGFGVSIITHPRKLTWQSNMTLKIMGDTSSNGSFSIVVLVFRGVYFPLYSLVHEGILCSWLVKSPDSCVGCHLQKRPKQPHGPKMFFSWRGWWKNCPRNFVFLGWSKRIAHFHYTFSVSLILWMSGNPNTNIMFLINHKHKAPKHESQDSTGGNIEYK